MDDCIFCKIIKGKLPCFKTFEDDNFLGFLDIKPLSLGNSLLIPKEHHRWVNDVPDFGAYWQAAKKLALATQKIVACDYVSYLTLGMEVHHAHIRIVPRWYEDIHPEGISTTEVVNVTQADMIAISTEIFNLTSK